MHTPDPYLAGHGDTRYRVTHYDLELQYRLATNRLDERARLHITVSEPTSQIDIDLHGLHTTEVLVDGRPAQHLVNPTRVSIEIGQRQAGDSLMLEMLVSGNPRPVPGVHGAAGWEELTDGAMVGAQPQGAPSWFPCNNDAANKATYRIQVTTASAYHVVANGSLVERADVGDNTRWVYEMNRPMSPYLATVQIGRYREELRQAAVPVSIVCSPHARVGAETAFAHQAEMVDFFSELYGPYPFAEYRAVIIDDEMEIPLEAQGLSSFGRDFIPPTWRNERLVAHELSHQWFGNCVTGRQLRDIWLHEGFACYSEWLWSEHKRNWCESPTAQERAAERYASLEPVPAGSTLARPGMAHMFDDWVYKRGALTLHALRALVGDTVFFDLLRGWVRENAFGLVTSEQFIEHCRRYGGVGANEIDELFAAWLFRAELPALPVLQ
ncbi:M1 family metallopeptidase [uncultured Gulosibacter sp.]|uniref:M1 family metallopeptidase n=1 Tax=uncultured Gulosibacter sp. TaxID=1339167 RepID=UPI00288AA512|nr:M1 family metallopeptidase [uncultured Gulosibacter sp.]